ncbi:MFS monocarboxylate transporter [Aureobasidium subglaciale]|nr:MFS monocarboxylate transporter [Aureobasidium subglaciale]
MSHIDRKMLAEAEIQSSDTSIHAPEEKELKKRSTSVLIGAFCAFFCSVGFFNAFGLFQEYYHANQLSNETEFDISWPPNDVPTERSFPSSTYADCSFSSQIGSFAICAMYLSSPVVGISYDRIGPHVLLCIGTVGVLFAIFMVSLCEEYYQIFLAQSLVFGVSSAFLVTPSLSTLTKYFRKNRALGMGIVVAGSSTGGVVWPIVLDQLLNHTTLGFSWTIRIVAFIMLPLLGLSCLLVRAPAIVTSHQDEKDEATKAKPKADFSIVKKPAFILCCAGMAIANLGMFSPLFYISSYAVSLNMSTSFTFYLVSIVNGASFFGRVLPGILADRYGCFNLLSSASLASGIVAFCWTRATNVAGVTFWALAYGFASGAIMSLQTACIASLATPETMGTAMGLSMGSIALMVLFGTPISGQLVGQYGYLELSMFSGSTLIVGAVLIGCARLKQDRKMLSAI